MDKTPNRFSSKCSKDLGDGKRPRHCAVCGGHELRCDCGDSAAGGVLGALSPGASDVGGCGPGSTADMQEKYEINTYIYST